MEDGRESIFLTGSSAPAALERTNSGYVVASRDKPSETVQGSTMKSKSEIISRFENRHDIKFTLQFRLYGESSTHFLSCEVCKIFILVRRAYRGNVQSISFNNLILNLQERERERKNRDLRILLNISYHIEFLDPQFNIWVKIKSAKSKGDKNCSKNRMTSKN